MFRLSKFLFLAGSLSLLLTACGTSNESDSTNNQVQEESTGKSIDDQNQETNNDSDQNSEQKDEQNSETESQEKSDQSVPEDETTTPATEKTLSYSFHDELKTEQAHLTKSDNQDFSLYVLPSYDLRAVEPYNDEIYYKEDDHFFMRINILPTDTDQDVLTEDTLTQLQAMNENVQTLDAPDDEFLQNATIMEASKDGELVTAYIINQQNAMIKLMLFTTEADDHRDAFIQMAKTLTAGTGAEAE